MKLKTILLKTFILATTIIVLTGCSTEKIYKYNGIKVTMAKGLFYRPHENADFYYENNNLFVIGIKETFEELLELDINHETTIEEYVNEVFLNSGQSYDLIKDENLYYYTYEYEINNHNYYYVSTIHKSYDSFWVLNFACRSDDKDKYHALFIKWGKSITFY